jgi:hypothetical protein
MAVPSTSAGILSQKRAALNAYIQEHGLGNVVLHEVLGPTGPTIYAMMCTVCSHQAQWLYNVNEFYGIELDLLKGFCEGHRHGKEPVPKLSQPMVGEGTPLTKSAIKDAVEMLMHPQMKADIEEDGDPFNLLGDIKTHIGGTITSISSSSIKWVARKSNFNVDLQCRKSRRGPEYRATCEVCNEHTSLTHEAVLALDRGIFSGDFQQFLMIHKHEAADRAELPKGRKFRHASKHG